MTHSEEEHVSVALLDGPSNIREAMQCVDANKWELAMQEKYESLIEIGRRN